MNTTTATAPTTATQKRDLRAARTAERMAKLAAGHRRDETTPCSYCAADTGKQRSLYAAHTR